MNPSKITHLSLPHSPVPKKPRAPKHISTPSRRWFDSVVSTFVMEDTDVGVLISACEQFDLAEAARETLEAEGRFLTDDKKGTRYAHPAVKVYKDATALAAKLVRDLKLDMPPARAPGRPPGHGISPRRG